MTAKELKASILDLAVRGKLVPQDPNDEPASVLLEKIRSEKQKLVKAGKIKKEKNPSEIYIASDGRPYEKFADGSETCIENEAPFELPNGWAWARLGCVALSITDGDHQPPPQTTAGVPFLVISNVSGGDVSFEHLRYVAPEYFASLSEDRKPAFGDLLFTVTGSYGIPIRIETNREFCFQRHIALLKFTHSNTEYLKSVLASPFVKKQCDDVATGTAQKTIPLSGLRNLLIPIPPENEQRRILAKIEALMPLLKSYSILKQAQCESEAEFPVALKKSILQSAVEGKLVPQDPDDEPVEKLIERIADERKTLIKAGKLKRGKHESAIFRGSDRLTYETRDGETVCIEDELPFKIPESWAWVRLGAVSNYGQCTGTDNAPKGSWMLDLEDIERGGRLLTKNRTRESNSTKHVFMKGQVLYSKLRTYLQKVLVADEDGYCTSEIIPITFFGAINPHFATLVLNSPYFVDYTQECCCGVKMPRLTTEDARVAYFPLPPLAEQQRIVAEVERMEAQVAQLQ